VPSSSSKRSGKDSETLNTILHCIGDFERISDHARNVKEAAQEMYDKKLDFSDKAQEELKVFERAVHDILDITMNSFIKGDLNLARQVEPMEEVIDGLSLDVKQRHVRRLRKGKCTIELGFILSDVITNFERVSDHCSNIAVCLVQVNEDEFDTHAYLDELRQEDNLDFQGKVMACREKYQLPPTKQDRVMEKNAKLLAE
jgi:phosphate:Na+ symporter